MLRCMLLCSVRKEMEIWDAKAPSLPWLSCLQKPSLPPLSLPRFTDCSFHQASLPLQRRRAPLTGYGVCKIQTNPVHLPNPTLGVRPNACTPMGGRDADTDFPFFPLQLRGRAYEGERRKEWRFSVCFRTFHASITWELSLILAWPFRDGLWSKWSLGCENFFSWPLAVGLQVHATPWPDVKHSLVNFSLGLNILLLMWFQNWECDCISRLKQNVMSPISHSPLSQFPFQRERDPLFYAATSKKSGAIQQREGGRELSSSLRDSNGLFCKDCFLFWLH